MSSAKSPSSYQDAFARHGFQQGLPLWNPTPVSLPRDRQNEGLKIGDVGIIDRDGYFQSIFNICNPPDLALEHRYGFPSNFSRIGEPNAIDYNSFPPGHVFSSPETSWSYSSLDVSHYTDPSTTSISGVKTHHIAYLSEDGAHIVVPQGATCSKLALDDHYLFEDTAKINWSAWFDFARNKLRGRLNTLHLITGLSRTRSWAVASFNKKDGLEVKVTCGLVEQDGKLFVSASRWTPVGRFASGIGPRTGTQEHVNQTVFIQTFTITSDGVAQPPDQEQLVLTNELETSRGGKYIGRETMAQAPHHAGSVQHANGSTGGTNRTGGTLAQDEDVTIRHIPETTPPFHPSEIINRYLLTKRPSAEVAITHDSTWITMLASGQLSKLDDLEKIVDRIVSEHHSIVLTDDIVCLGNKDVLPISGHNNVLTTTNLQAPTSTNESLCWTNQDPRESQLFNTWGVLYRFTTVASSSGMSTTTLWRAVRTNREDRVAKLEWASNGGLGRAVIGKSTVPMSDLVRPDPHFPGARIFNAPDGLQYRWRPSYNSLDIMLEDPARNVVAFFRPTRPTRYQIGDVYGELNFLRNAGAGTITHPPMMDMVTITAMLYRFCQALRKADSAPFTELDGASMEASQDAAFMPQDAGSNLSSQSDDVYIRSFGR